MFTVNSRAKIIYVALIAVVFSSALTPNTALVKPSVAQEDLTKFLVDSQAEGSLVQTPEVLIQCVGSLSDCSDTTPNIALTEVIDFTNDDRFIEFKILCEGWNCTKRDIYYSVTMDVEWGNGIDAPWFFESATLTTSPAGSGGFINMPCGGGLSGSCTLSTSGVISADAISPDPNASVHFGIANTGGSSAAWEWNHRVLNIQVSLAPIVDPIGDCADTFEPDNTPATGSTLLLGAGEYQRHTLCPQNDEDWAKFQATNTQPNLLVETFDLEPDDINPNGDTQLTVLDELENQIGTNQDRGLGPFPGSPDILQSSRVVWHPAESGVFNIKVSPEPETQINEQVGSGYSLRLTNPFTDVDPVDQASWGPTKVNVPLVWRSDNVIYFTQYFTYDQAELDVLNNVNKPATLAWEFRRPGVDTNTGKEIDESNVDYGDYWQNVNGVCIGEYWTNLPNHSDRFVEESDPPGGCQSPYPNNPLASDNEEFELYVDKTSQLVAGKPYYITIKFYIHPQYLNNDYQFYISKAEYCELWGKYDFFCNILPDDDLDKLTANLIEGYMQPAP